ncbi:acyltransferase [Pontibacter liquoris]|uniref:acyltransferase n=1 Tax=Pontibacter liquoris TaxID=2905677 RepID=UPI001FA7908C|nr:acyltransferase [Pontibacter liquoris]
MLKVLRYLKVPFTYLKKSFLEKKRAKSVKLKGINNYFSNKGLLTNVLVDVIGNNNEIIIGSNTIIRNTLIYLRGDNHRLYLGQNCYFGEGELWMEDRYGSLLIHENTTIERGHLAVTEPYSKLEIKKDCMLARHVEIRTGDSHSILDLETGKRINRAANVTLEEHVWVGAHAKILKGVTVGHNSVIGTASIVTKSVPPHSVVAGIPSRVVRTNIDWKRERIY